MSSLLNEAYMYFEEMSLIMTQVKNFLMFTCVCIILTVRMHKFHVSLWLPVNRQEISQHMTGMVVPKS